MWPRSSAMPVRQARYVSVGSGVLIWTVGDMAPYSDAVLKFVTQLVTEGVNTNFVVVNTTTNESDRDNNDDEASAFVSPICDVSVVKDVNVTEVNVNDTVEWTITVHNGGPSVAENVVVNDTLPDGWPRLKRNRATWWRTCIAKRLKLRLLCSAATVRSVLN